MDDYGYPLFRKPPIQSIDRDVKLLDFEASKYHIFGQIRWIAMCDYRRVYHILVAVLVTAIKKKTYLPGIYHMVNPSYRQSCTRHLDQEENTNLYDHNPSGHVIIGDSRIPLYSILQNSIISIILWNMMLLWNIDYPWNNIIISIIMLFNIIIHYPYPLVI